MGARASFALAGALLLVGTGEAEAKNPWEELMGRKPKLWHDPEGRFSIDLPVGWKAYPEEGAPIVRLVRPHPDTGLVAEVQIEIRPLPPGVEAAHLDAHVQASNRANAPGYAVRDRQKTVVAGRAAIQTLFTYRARGNAELSRETVQTVLVDGERGFVITLETIAGTRGVFWEEFELMLEGFSTGGGTGPSAHDRGRRGRKRIRAGEMVNPDMVGY